VFRASAGLGSRPRGQRLLTSSPTMTYKDFVNCRGPHNRWRRSLAFFILQSSFCIPPAFPSPAILHSTFCLLPSPSGGPCSVVRSPLIPFQLSTSHPPQCCYGGRVSVSAFPRSSVSRLCGSLVGALGTHYRRIWVALGWLCRRFRVAISWLSTGLGVALISY